jgi:hypothetical protein
MALKHLMRKVKGLPTCLRLDATVDENDTIVRAVDAGGNSSLFEFVMKIGTSEEHVYVKRPDNPCYDENGQILETGERSVTRSQPLNSEYPEC